MYTPCLYTPLSRPCLDWNTRTPRVVNGHRVLTRAMWVTPCCLFHFHNARKSSAHTRNRHSPSVKTNHSARVPP